MNARSYGVAERKRSLNHDVRLYVQRYRHGIMNASIVCSKVSSWYKVI